MREKTHRASASESEFLSLIEQADDLLQQIEKESDVEHLNHLHSQLEGPLERLEVIMWSERKWKDASTWLLAVFYLNAKDEQSSKLDIQLRIHQQIVKCLNQNEPALQSLIASGENLYEYFGRLHRVANTVFQYSLFRELTERLDENETRNGKKVRDFLVHKNQTSLDQLLWLVLWNTASLPGDSRTDEKKSLAHLKIVEELNKHLSIKAIALDPKGLEALVEGRFNRTPWHIRERLRTSLEKEFRFENRKVELSNETEPASVGSIRTQAPDTAAIDAKIIMEKVAKSLTPRQRQFLEIRPQVDSDKEVAEKMGVRPEAVSQLRSKVKEAFKKVLQD
jgi:hypothetical protein